MKSSNIKLIINRLVLFGLIFFILIFLISCGAMSSEPWNSEEGLEAPIDDFGYYELEAESAVDDFELETSNKIANLEQPRKLVKSGDLEIRAEDVEASYQFILELVQKYKGFETYVNQSENNDYLSVVTTLAIPSESLDEYLQAINESQDIKYININAEDITDSYFDTETRLENLEKSLEKYYQFLDEAKTVEDMLAIQTRIDEITTDIELLKGKLNLWDNQVNYSYLTISIYQQEDIVNIKRDVDFSALSWEEMTYFLRSGWTRILNILVGALQWLVIALLIVAPIVIPILIIIFLILHFSKKRKGKKEKAKQEQQNLSNNNSPY